MSYDIKDAVFNGLEFHEIEVGLVKTLTHTITQKDVDNFASLTGDFNPVHVDPEFAKTTSFGKNVVHGMLTSSFISTMIGMLIPGPGALWTSQTLEFLNPSFVGDIITVNAKVIRKSEATRSLVLAVEVINQKGTKVVSGESTVKVLELKKKNKSEVKMEKITLITGSAKGIGAAIAKKLSADGHVVLINFIKSEMEAKSLQQEIAASGGKAFLMKGDVSSQEEVNAIFDRTEKEIGTITSIVHCSSPHPIPKPLSDLEWSDFQNHLDVQVKGAFYCLKRALPNMIAQNSGSIVMMSSIFTNGIPPVQQSPYIMAKASLEALAKTISVEFGVKGVRCNVVSPGMTHTEMISNIPEKTKMLAKMNTPLRKLAEPDDIAATVAFLMSDGAKHITGENIKVCGGLVM
ncbi:MAG: SDR family oxidoreductase [Bacteriovoracaceae bacterium]